MKKTISTLQVRQQLGDILDRVALLHDEYIIERKGKPLAAVVPVGKLIQLEAAARKHMLDLLGKQKSTVKDAEALDAANEAKHVTRNRGKKERR